MHFVVLSCLPPTFPVTILPGHAHPLQQAALLSQDRLAAGESQTILLRILASLLQASALCSGNQLQLCSLSLCQHSGPCVAPIGGVRISHRLFWAHHFCSHNFSGEALKGTGPSEVLVSIISGFVWVCLEVDPH